MNFLAEERFYHGHDLVVDMKPEDNSDLMGERETASQSSTVDLEAEYGWEEDPNCFESFHSRFAPSRRLNNLFFLEELAVSTQKSS